MTSLATPRTQLDRARFALAVGALFIAAVLLLGGGLVEVIEKAANIPDDTPEGLGKFVKTSDRLFTPFLIASVAIAPIGAAVGVLMTQFGSRKGPLVIGAALGGVVLMASLKGIVA